MYNEMSICGPVCRDSGIGSQGIINSLEWMTKVKSTVLNLDKPSYAMG